MDSQRSIDSADLIPATTLYADASMRVRLAVEKAASRDAAAMHALRIAVCEYTFALREEGLTPEIVLIKLKSLIDDRTRPQFTQRDARYGEGLRQNISTWCIKAYFNSAGTCT